jgi:hypothetical protein
MPPWRLSFGRPGLLRWARGSPRRRGYVGIPADVGVAPPASVSQATMATERRGLARKKWRKRATNALDGGTERRTNRRLDHDYVKRALCWSHLSVDDGGVCMPEAYDAHKGQNVSMVKVKRPWARSQGEPHWPARASALHGPQGRRGEGKHRWVRGPRVDEGPQKLEPQVPKAG